MYGHGGCPFWYAANLHHSHPIFTTPDICTVHRMCSLCPAIVLFWTSQDDHSDLGVPLQKSWFARPPATSRWTWAVAVWRAGLVWGLSLSETEEQRTWMAVMQDWIRRSHSRTKRRCTAPEAATRRGMSLHTARWIYGQKRHIKADINTSE